MAVDRVLDFQRRNIFAARDDHILAAVLDLDITVGLHHRQVAGVEPAARERIAGRAGILQVPLHRHVSAEHDLAHRLAIPRHRLHRLRVHHGDRLFHQVTHALPAHALGPLPDVHLSPRVVPGADGGRSVGFGEAIDVHEVEPHPFHSLDHRRRRRRRGHHRVHRVRDAGARRCGCVGQQRVDNRGAAVVRHAMIANRVEDGARFHLAQADVGTGQRGHRPDKAPAVAVKHRQCPQIHAVPRHFPVDDIGRRVQISAAMVVDDALRIAGRARCVVERNRFPLIGRMPPAIIRIAAGNETFVLEFAEQLAGAAVLGIIDVDHDRTRLDEFQRALDRRRELAIGDQHLRLAVIEHESDGFAVEAGVQRVQHPAHHRHAEMRVGHRRNIGQHHRHRIADADAQSGKRAREPAAARIGLAPRRAKLPVDDRRPVRINVRGALDV